MVDELNYIRQRTNITHNYTHTHTQHIIHLQEAIN